MSCLILSNVALPSVFGHQFFMFGALLLVITIESFIIARLLNKSFGDTFIPCSKANIISTLLGFPIGYIGSFAFFFFTTSILNLVAGNHTLFIDTFDTLSSHSLFMGGIVNYEKQFEILAAAFMLIPYYYASVFIENKCLQKSFPNIDIKKVHHTAIIMNRITYAILGLLILTFFFIESYNYGRIY